MSKTTEFTQKQLVEMTALVGEELVKDLNQGGLYELRATNSLLVRDELAEYSQQLKKREDEILDMLPF